MRGLGLATLGVSHEGAVLQLPLPAETRPSGDTALDLFFEANSLDTSAVLNLPLPAEPRLSGDVALDLFFDATSLDAKLAHARRSPLSARETSTGRGMHGAVLGTI